MEESPLHPFELHNYLTVNLGGLDISPVILLLLIFFLERVIAYYLYPLVIAY